MTWHSVVTLGTYLKDKFSLGQLVKNFSPAHSFLSIPRDSGQNTLTWMTASTSIAAPF